jgi:hypothetical protein
MIFLVLTDGGDFMRTVTFRPPKCYPDLNHAYIYALEVGPYTPSSLTHVLPSPHRHRHHYHGVFAPNAPLRKAVAACTMQP